MDKTNQYKTFKRNSSSQYLSPIRLKPFQDELLSSFLIRTSIALGTDPIGYSGTIWSGKRIWTLDIDRFMSKHDLVALSSCTGISLNDLENLTLQPNIFQILANPPKDTTQAWPWITPISSRNRYRTSGLHFCPECLKETPIYFRKDWRISWNVACPKHKLLLSTSCPNCNTHISPHLITFNSTSLIHCIKCGYDLTTIPAQKAVPEVIKLQNSINNLFLRLNEDFPWEISGQIEYFSTLQALIGFLQKVRSCNNLSESFFSNVVDNHNPTFTNSKARFENLSIEERQFLMLCAGKLFSMPLPNVLELFKKTKVTPSLLSQSNSKNYSDTIGFLYNSLSEYRILNKTSSRTPKTIRPRTKDEVRKLMDDIKCFL